ncbi:uncharacterized protein EI90DRAFT_1467304 [Cantharellus anzutake]|uniref:uncharacterized protein n=1 Tax=Cantharellus anzutake TaxID=1750568 RepID=UPI001908733B|nr:uncharacterized protein EI90DRAFT_1467304 [Cantharellus anzutake]KAF8309612.1 hypothetical protein EI90DRAFT_1467304 [Cantharellus anzutake]
MLSTHALGVQCAHRVHLQCCYIILPTMKLADLCWGHLKVSSQQVRDAPCSSLCPPSRRNAMPFRAVESVNSTRCPQWPIIQEDLLNDSHGKGRGSVLSVWECNKPSKDALKYEWESVQVSVGLERGRCPKYYKIPMKDGCEYVAIYRPLETINK